MAVSHRAPTAPRGGVPLILLQRFRGTMDDWDPDFIEAISADRGFIRFESAGIGRSDGTVPETISGMAAIAAVVIGSVVARQLTLDFPHLVRRLIVAGSSPGAIADGPQAHRRVPQVMT